MNEHSDRDDESLMDGLFADEADDSAEASRPWKILVVDDDPDVHKVTRIALMDFEFDGRRVEVQSAHSGAEARGVFEKHPDVGLALVDVVMESDTAGLEFVDWLRDQTDMPIRVLIRTGDPVAAPPAQIAARHRIDGYLDKTLLTAERLKAQLIIELRAFSEACRLRGN